MPRSLHQLNRVSLVLLLGLAACAGPHPGGSAASRQDALPALQLVRIAQVSGTDALLIAVSPVNDDVAWVSGQRGTWLRTLDGGAHWQLGRVPGADSLQFRDVHAVSADTAWLLSIGNGAQSRIYHTVNGGASWQLQFTNLEPQGFYDCFDFWDAQRGIVIGDAIASGIAVLRTANGGGTWTRVPPDSLPRAQEGEGSFAASGRCLVTRPGGRAWIVMSSPARARLLGTADYGRSWRLDTLPITVRAGSGPQAVAFSDDRNGMVLGGGYESQPGDTLAAVTTDGGLSWRPVMRPPLARGIWGGVFVPGARVPTVIAVGPDGIVHSRDRGNSWLQLDTLNYWSVGFASARAGWAVGAGGRITKLSGF
jgi:photosystem II stability/assembly factor-like uncharacterized protein